MPKASKKFELPKEIRTQADLKKFDAYFREVVKKGQIRSREEKAFETLRPALIKKHIQNGQDLVLYPKVGGTLRYTPADLKKIDALLRKTEKKYGASEQGAPIDKLLKACLPIDIARAKGQVSDGSGIRNASLYNTSGNILYFMVTASPKSKHKFHQVRIRLEAWTSQMVSARNYVDAVKKTIRGRVSFDCDCGRNQFYYRFLAVIGNYAITPPTEKDFPKIRNPKLVGCACKHVIKCLDIVQSAGTIQRLAGIMKKQADAEGFSEKDHFEKAKDVKDDLSGKEKKAKPEKPEKPDTKSQSKAKTDKSEKPEPKAKLDTKQPKPKQPSEKVKKAFKEKEKKVIQSLQERISKKEAENARLKFNQELTKYLGKAVYRDGKTKEQAISDFAKERGQDVKLITAMGAEVLAEF